MNRSGLTMLERHVLADLMRADARARQRTASAISGRTGVPGRDVRRVLEQLDSIEPKLVHRQSGASSVSESWIALESVIVALDEQRESSPPRQFARRPRGHHRARRRVTLA